MGTPPTEQPTSTLGGGTCDAFNNVLQEWTAGGRGELKIPVAQLLDTWTVEVGFSAPVRFFRIENSRRVAGDTCDKKLFAFAHKAHNKRLTAGTTTSFKYTYRFKRNEARPTLAYIKSGNAAFSQECGVKPDCVIVATETPATTTQGPTTTEEVTTEEPETTPNTEKPTTPETEAPNTQKPTTPETEEPATPSTQEPTEASTTPEAPPTPSEASSTEASSTEASSTESSSTETPGASTEDPILAPV